MIPQNRRYLAYLLRMWQTQYDGQLVWWASIESPQTGERMGFSSPAAMYDYLKEKMEEVSQDSQPEDSGIFPGHLPGDIPDED